MGASSLDPPSRYPMPRCRPGPRAGRRRPRGQHRAGVGPGPASTRSSRATSPARAWRTRVVTFSQSMVSAWLGTTVKRLQGRRGLQWATASKTSRPATAKAPATRLNATVAADHREGAALAQDISAPGPTMWARCSSVSSTATPAPDPPDRRGPRRSPAVAGPRGRPSRSPRPQGTGGQRVGLGQRRPGARGWRGEPAASATSLIVSGSRRSAGWRRGQQQVVAPMSTRAATSWAGSPCGDRSRRPARCRPRCGRPGTCLPMSWSRAPMTRS